MIPKKDNLRSDPTNYRPISLTSSLARLCERFILTQINDHLTKNKIIIKEQSGFRPHRQTKDNILTICQRNIQAFNQKKKNCTIFFDINKAFDKVWHLGLIKKLKDIKLNTNIIFWIQEFLKNRTYTVNVNNTLSDPYKILAGVPQGGVLSPILFAIYINDIVFESKSKTKIYSNLFADDLSASCAAKKLTTIEKALNLYLKKLENWVSLWRLTMSTNKCNFIIFTKTNNKKNLTLKLKFFDEYIPQSYSTKFLGITLDSNLTFKEYTNEIYTKCMNRLNIIKILSQPKYKLTNKTLTIIYFTLIRSILDYSSLIFFLLSETNKKKLRSIQYHCLRFANRLPLKTSHTELLELTGVCSLDDRFDILNKKYFEKAFLYENRLIIDLCTNYKNSHPLSRSLTYKTPFCFYRNEIFEHIEFLE